MSTLEFKDLNAPDEITQFEKGRAEIVELGGMTVGRGVLQPGWSWSQHMKPIAKTDLCQIEHVLYVVSGRLGVRMADGTEHEFKPGQVGVIPPGHDGWVIGDEPFIDIDWSGRVSEFGR